MTANPDVNQLNLEEKKALLKKLIAQKAAQSNAAPEAWPLSQGQEALWFLQAMQAKGNDYNSGFALRLKGSSDLHHWQTALDQVLADFPILRGHFITREGKPFMVLSDKQLRVQEEDTSLLSESELLQKVKAAHQEPFDLQQGPLLRLQVFLRADQECILLLSIHHIIFDNGSTPLLLQGLLTQYFKAAGLPWQPESLKEENPFWKFATEEQEALSGEQGKKLEAYWTEALCHVHEPAPLQAYPAAGSQKEGGSHVLQLDQRCHQQLRSAAKQAGVTPFTWLLSAFQATLHRHQQQEYYQTGIASSLRSTQRWWQTMGYFVNTLPISSRYAQGDSFADFLKATAATMSGALAHQQFPFPAMKRLAGIRQASDEHPIFQVVFNFLNNTELFAEDWQQGLAQNELEVSEYDMASQEAVFDLTMEVSDLGHGLQLHCKYRKDRYDADFIAAFCQRYEHLLLQSLRAPGTLLGDFELSLPGDATALAKLSNPRGEALPEENLIAAFEAVVAQYPENVALVSKSGRHTYAQLDALSKQLAAGLQAEGIRPGDRVALQFGRDAGMIISLLAVLRSGATYVPIDPDYPESRKEQMLGISEAKLALTDAPGRLSAKAPVMHWEELMQSAAGKSPELPGNTGKHPAYIMYTSGSTGTPKAVPASHRSILNLITAQDRLPFSAEDKLCSFSNFVFDGSTYDIFACLLHGACLHLPDESLMFDADRLIRYLQEEEISLGFMATAFFNKLASIEPCFTHSFRELYFGGEVPDLDLVQKVLAAAKPGLRLYNIYGPTETTTFALNYPIEQAEAAKQFLPIGQPLRGISLKVLDKNGANAIPGTVGELYIAGEGLSSGYLNHPQDAFAPIEGIPHYRTGDLCTLLPDGNIHFLGRADQQVKFRGYRIELSEIAHALRQHPGVQEAAVFVLPKPAERLVAVATGTCKDQQELHDFLKKDLPHYMLPQQWLFIEHLPLNANTKVDYHALRTLAGKAQQETAPYVAPASPLESELQAIWQEALGIAPISTEANFFELGGHSLLAMRIISQVREKYQAEVPVAQLFTEPTIRGLAGLIAKAQESAYTSSSTGPALSRRSREQYRRKRS